ncbi:MAG: SH3 domain-containing protein [Pseudomonadota bacterium]
MNFFNSSSKTSLIIFGLIVWSSLNGCAQTPFEYPKADDGLALVPTPVLPEMWVSANSLNKRTCPNLSCGIVGRLVKDNSVQVYEEKNDWVRVTPYTAVLCEKNINEFVIAGNSECSKENGVQDNQMAEWTYKEYLIFEMPNHLSEEKIEKLPHDYSFVNGSDDYTYYEKVFNAVSLELIRKEECSEEDFHRTGGWLKSMSQKNEPIYFAYCGGWKPGNRVYLNVDTGKIFK